MGHDLHRPQPRKTRSRTLRGTLSPPKKQPQKSICSIPSPLPGQAPSGDRDPGHGPTRNGGHGRRGVLEPELNRYLCW